MQQSVVQKHSYLPNLMSVQNMLAHEQAFSLLRNIFNGIDEHIFCISLSGPGYNSICFIPMKLLETTIRNAD